MSGDLRHLLSLHDLAARFGSGLKPELEAVLRAQVDPPSSAAIPLPVRTHSVGPAHQTATEEQLSAEGITVLRRPQTANKRPVRAQR